MFPAGCGVIRRRIAHVDSAFDRGLDDMLDTLSGDVKVGDSIGAENQILVDRVAFTQALRGRVSVPIQMVDERLTTVQGERALLEMDTSRRKRKQMIDQVAAQLILQQFLDQQRGNEPSS